MAKSSTKQPNKDGAIEWFRIGDSEFAFARLGLRDKENKFYAEVCFMLQQAIEKYLKGFLVYHNGAPEKVHDLGYICK